MYAFVPDCRLFSTPTSCYQQPLNHSSTPIHIYIDSGTPLSHHHCSPSNNNKKKKKEKNSTVLPAATNSRHQIFSFFVRYHKAPSSALHPVTFAFELYARLSLSSPANPHRDHYSIEDNTTSASTLSFTMIMAFVYRLMAPFIA